MKSFEVQRLFNVYNREKLLSLNMLRLTVHRCSSTLSGNDLRAVMQYVPTSVVVVTSRDHNDGTLRGVTCSSFTSVSAKPPVVSFCMQNPSRFHNLLTKSDTFAVNVLAETQANLSIHFSTPVGNDENQFSKIAHHFDPEHRLPLIDGCVANLICGKRSYDQIGDHFVWYGDVLRTLVTKGSNSPLLFFGRSYRSIGDDAFIAAFEDTTLPFDFWTHKAHLRMAWNYLKQNDIETALNKVRSGINKFNQSNSDKIIFGYSETISVFFLTMVHNAILSSENTQNESFEEFLSRNSHLTDTNLPYEYYSKDVFLSEEAKIKFVPPDLKHFDSSLSKRV